MHTNRAVRHKRNKHGRKGVFRAMRNIPLSEAQAIEVKERAFKAGFNAGSRDAVVKAQKLVDGSKTIRAARKALEELVG